MVDVQNELAQVLVNVASVRVQALSDVLQCLKEAVQVHLSVLTPANHVLVNNVVVGLAYVRVCHVFKLGQPLELIRRNEVIIFLASENFEYGLCLRVKVQFIVVAVWVGQDQFEHALLGRSRI